MALGGRLNQQAKAPKRRHPKGSINTATICKLSNSAPLDAFRANL
jgi:hypothetical protein